MVLLTRPALSLKYRSQLMLETELGQGPSVGKRHVTLRGC